MAQFGGSRSFFASRRLTRANSEQAWRLIRAAMMRRKYFCSEENVGWAYLPYHHVMKEDSGGAKTLHLNMQGRSETVGTTT
jgi:hypothetical protein